MDKCHYLRRYLAAAAAAIIAELPTTYASFNNVIAVLYYLFSDNQYIEHLHLTALEHLQNVKSADDPQTCRHMQTKMPQPCGTFKKPQSLTYDALLLWSIYIKPLSYGMQDPF